jgi:hypothetical protein
MSPNAKARRAAHAANVAARRAQVSGTIRCYIEPFLTVGGVPDLRLREKVTKRLVRVVTANATIGSLAPLSNLLQDCYGHRRGLIEPRSRNEFVAITAGIVAQTVDEITVTFDGPFLVRVHIEAASVSPAPMSLWCYIEEYDIDGASRGVRLRQKNTGRKVEMYGKSRDHLATFLASPRFTGADESMPNLYEQDGYDDYVLVSGGTAIDSFDVIRFNYGAALTYLLGPTPDTAYRDAFRALVDESPTAAHARTAVRHRDDGRYREAVLNARLAVETAAGGRGADIKKRLADSPDKVQTAGSVLYERRNTAVHEGATRIEQRDADDAVNAMRTILRHLGAPFEG